MVGLFILLCSACALYSVWNGVKLTLAKWGFANEQPPRRERAQPLFLGLAVFFCVLACIAAVL